MIKKLSKILSLLKKENINFEIESISDSYIRIIIRQNIKLYNKIGTTNYFIVINSNRIFYKSDTILSMDDYSREEIFDSFENLMYEYLKNKFYGTI